MARHVFDAIFAFNYQCDAGSHSWDNIPPELWWNVIKYREQFGICRFGLQNIVSENGFADLAELETEPTFHPLASYKPYHGDSQSTVATFEVSQSLLSLLMTTRFDQWTTFNDRLAFDEVLFFDEGGIKIQAVPHENLILFYALTESQLSRLQSIDSRFFGNLYDTDNGMRPL